MNETLSTCSCCCRCGTCELASPSPEKKVIRFLKQFFTLICFNLCVKLTKLFSHLYMYICEFVWHKTIFTLVCVNLYKIKQFAHSYINFQFVCQFPEEYVVETMPPCMGHSWSPKSSFQATRESETGFLGWALSQARLGQTGQARQGGRKLVPLAPVWLCNHRWRRGRHQWFSSHTVLTGLNSFCHVQKCPIGIMT